MERVIELIKEFVTPIAKKSDANEGEIKEIWKEINQLTRSDDKLFQALNQLQETVGGLTNSVKWFIMTVIGSIIVYCIPKIFEIFKTL